jgi:hypothetical protein
LKFITEKVVINTLRLAFNKKIPKDVNPGGNMKTSAAPARRPDLRVRLTFGEHYTTIGSTS